MTTTRDVLNDFAQEIEALVNRVDLGPLEYQDEKEMSLDIYTAKVKQAAEKERKRNGR